MGKVSEYSLEKYKHYHIWMLIPFTISILGFSYSYYFDFSNATFHQHIHGISATLWYILVIVQPYLITHKLNFKRHKSLGITGVMIAGIVAGSALTIIPKNIDNVDSLDINGFFNPTFAYFATLIDLLLIIMFIISVILAIHSIKRNDLSSHVQWLMASVFFVLSPALLRMLGIGAIFLNEGNLEGIMMVKLAFPTMIVMLALIIIFYIKFGNFKHKSFWLLITSHLLFLLIKWIGDNEFFQNIISAIFKV